jgi:hypothetical protein
LLLTFNDEIEVSFKIKGNFKSPYQLLRDLQIITLLLF